MLLLEHKKPGCKPTPHSCANEMMKAKGGNKYAIVATANKIATIYYQMVRFKKEFKPVDLEFYQQKYKQAKITYLERKLQQLKTEAA